MSLIPILYVRKVSAKVTYYSVIELKHQLDELLDAVL